jgi:WD40 repeat protein
LLRLALDLKEPLEELPADSPHFEQPGDAIGRYKLLQQIGEGGCGIVYMAEQEEPIRRRVALKVIKLGMDTKNVIARFEAERQAMALMDHPNIAKVLDAGATNSGRPFFVMELVRGIKITEFCDQNNLSTRDRLNLFVQVCNAVQHAHQKGVIHRDIKPSNVLVALNDGVPAPKVIDFGIAKATQQTLTDKTLFTAFEQFIGTPAYMSPEQAEMNASGIDTRSDIYSLGVLLYELMTGQTPFDSKTLLREGVDEIRRIIREREPAKPSTRLSMMMPAELTTTAGLRQVEAPKLIHLVRGDLDWIVMKALEKDRARRYETANGLASDIQRHLDNEPVTARPPSGVYRLGKAVRRHKGAFAAGAAMAAVLLIGIVLSTTEAIRATSAQREQNRLRLQAEQAEDAAKRQEQMARASADEARRRFYAAQMNLASQAWDAAQLPRTLDLLATLLPRQGEEDLRGFEWYHFWTLCNGPLLHTFQAHSTQVTSLAFSPDGTTLATGGEDGRIGLWDTEAARQIFYLDPEPRSLVAAVVFSPDGKTLVSGGWDSLVRVWDAASGQLRAVLSDQKAWVRCLAISPDGKSLASAGDAGEIIIWDLATFQQQANLSGRRGVVTSLAFSRDNSTLAACTGWGEDGSGVDLWILENGTYELKSRIPVPAYSIAFSPDCSTLALAGYSDIQFWDMEAAQLRNASIRSAGNSKSMAFMPDGKSLLSCGSNRTVRLSQMPVNQTNAASQEIGAHLDSVLCVAASPDGTTLASGASDGSVKLWNTSAIPGQSTSKNANKFPPLLDVHSRGGIRSLLIVPNSNSVLAVSTHGADFRDIASGKRIAFWPEPTGRGAISPNGKLLATTALDNRVKLWDTTQRKLLASIEGQPAGDSGRLVAMAFSPDGKVLATGGYAPNEFIKFWDAEASLKLIRQTRTPHTAGISALAFSPDGKMLAAALLSDRVLITDASGRTERLIQVDGAEVPAIAFSPDSRLLATALDSGRISLWDVQTGRLHCALKGHTSTVGAITFTPDGSTLASASADSTVRLWDVATGQQRVAFESHTSSVTSLVFSQDGDTLIQGRNDGVITLRRGTHVPEADVQITPVEQAGPNKNAADYNALAWTLATAADPKLRDGQRALDFAEQAVAATNRKDPMIMDTLAAAYAELGQFTNAVRCQEEAIALLDKGQLKADGTTRLKLYKSNTPYRTQ